MAQGSIFYASVNALAVTGAITLIQVKTGANAIQILRATVHQTNLTASAMQRVGIVRKSAAATVTSFTPLKYRTADAVSLCIGSTSATGTNASVEGTDTDIVVAETFNVLNGWTWIPTPEERIVVPTAAFIGLKLLDAPAASMTTTARLVFEEWV